MSLIKTIIAYVIAMFFHGLYKNVWIIAERGTDARDNAYWLFKYIRENENNQKIYYVIDPKSADYSKISILGPSIKTNSLKHGIVLFSARVIISTHAYLCCPTWKGSHYALNHKCFNKHEKRIYIQHGLVKDYLPELTYPNLDVDLYTSGAKPEHLYLVNNYGFPDGVVQYTGLARYDNLYNHQSKKNEKNKLILLMPTWRHYLSECESISDFKESDFYKRINELLESNALKELLKKYDYSLVFYPHYEMQKWCDAFKPSDRITIADFNNFDVQNLLMECDVLITDYSSVFFDIAYMKKPIIFYQFDSDLFRKTQYKEGYFKYEGSFGPVLLSFNQVVNSLEKILEDGIEPMYLKNESIFFELNDNNCCSRIVRAIKDATCRR